MLTPTTRPSPPPAPWRPFADQGHRVVLVTATRGELGEIPEGLLRPGETLAERRLAELTEACRSSVSAARPTSAIWTQGWPVRPATTARAVSQPPTSMRPPLLWPGSSPRRRADVLVTYDEHGGYGHPDHVQVHRVGMRAAELAGTPVVYMATMNRDFMRSLPPSRSNRRSGSRPRAPRTEGMDTMGEPADRLTTEVDVTRWIETQACQAMSAHASQISETSFFLSMPPTCSHGVGTGVVHPGPPSRRPASGDGRREAGSAGRARRRERRVAGGGAGQSVTSRVTATHRVLRVHGGQLVVAERRLELEAELDAAAAEGFAMVT